MRISDWSSDVCSSDLIRSFLQRRLGGHRADHIVERELLDLAPIEFDQPGGEWLRVLLDPRFHRPVFARHERADLQLPFADQPQRRRSEEHTSELQSLMRISYAVFCLKKKT